MNTELIQTAIEIAEDADAGDPGHADTCDSRGGCMACTVTVTISADAETDWAEEARRKRHYSRPSNSRRAFLEVVENLKALDGLYSESQQTWDIAAHRLADATGDWTDRLELY